MKNRNQSDTPLNRRSLAKNMGVLGIASWAGAPAALGFPHFFRGRLPTTRQHRDVLIVGSGFGGAIAAQRLTARGQSVTLLERGRRWERKDNGEKTFSSLLTPDGRSTWRSNWTPLPLGPKFPVIKGTGVLENNSLANLQVLQAAAYGGGSIVYGGVLVKPEERIFNLVFPDFLPFSQLQPYYEHVSAQMHRADMPEDIYQSDAYTHVRVMKQHCDRAGIQTALVQGGYKWDLVRDEVEGRAPPSVTHGEAVYGTNSKAKVSLTDNYLAMAESSGLLEVKTLHSVTGIKRGASDLYEVEVEELNECGEVIAQHTFTCYKLFLNAGSIGTTSLLVKAKALGLLPDLNEHVGDGWGNNGNCYALRVGIPEPTGRWQGGPPALGIEDYDNEDTPVFIEHPQFPLGFDARLLMYFSVGINPSRGRFYFDTASQKVKLDWPQGDANGQTLVNRALLRVMDRLNKANGGITSSLIDNFKRNYNDSAVYHALGGCVMGKACDEFGRLHNYPGIYVSDSSLMPGSAACTNPSLTIAAIAERNLDHITLNDF
jgi:cholesterol oxidase